MEKIDKAYEGSLTEKDEAVTIRRIRIKIANAKDFSENLFYKLHCSSHSIHVPVYFFNGNEIGAFARIVQNSYNDLMVEIMGHCDLDIFKWHDTGELIVQMFPGGCAVAHNRKPEPPSNVLIKEGSDIERPVRKSKTIEIHASNFESHKVDECPWCGSHNSHWMFGLQCSKCENILDFCYYCFVNLDSVECSVCGEKRDFNAPIFRHHVSDRIHVLENELENVKAAKEWDGTADTLKTISQMTEIKTEKLNPFVTELMSCLDELDQIIEGARSSNSVTEIDFFTTQPMKIVLSELSRLIGFAEIETELCREDKYDVIDKINGGD